MQERMTHVQLSGLPWLLIEVDKQVLGYAYATPWKARGAYRYSVESTVYIRPQARGQGLGTGLYGELLTQLKARQVHTVIGGISLPNTASIALHEKMGMTQIAHFKQVGYKFEQWLDVGYWQLILDSQATY